MDSSAYRHLILDLQKELDTTSGHVPRVFARSYPSCTPESMEALLHFLTEISGNGANATEKEAQEHHWDKPRILGPDATGTLASLLRDAHINLTRFLYPECTVSDEENRALRRNGSQLAAFLARCANPRGMRVFAHDDAVSLAMAVFLLEGAMHVGWCPNAFEIYGKRAAHVYFSYTKKALWTATPKTRNTVLCYMFGAWILAQKTEGVTEQRLENEVADYVYDYSWYTAQGTAHYRSYHLYRVALFSIIPQKHHSIPHPFERIENEDRVGLRLWVHDTIVRPAELLKSTPIQRQKFRGFTTKHVCVLDESELFWTVALQIFEGSLYRIDVLESRGAPCEITRAELTCEAAGTLTQSAPGHLVYLGAENTAIELIDNPFGLVPLESTCHGLTTLRGHGSTLLPRRPQRMTTAWKTARGAQTVDKTNLLGIFEG